MSRRAMGRRPRRGRYQTDLWRSASSCSRWSWGSTRGRRAGLGPDGTGVFTSRCRASARGRNPSDEVAAIIDRCLQKPKPQRFAGARGGGRGDWERRGGGRAADRRARSAAPGAVPPPAALRLEPHSASIRSRSRRAPLLRRGRDVAPRSPCYATRRCSRPRPSGVGSRRSCAACVVPALKASGDSWWSDLVVRPAAPMAALAYARLRCEHRRQLDDRHVRPPRHGDRPGHHGGPSLNTGAVGCHPDLSQQNQLVASLYAEPGYLGAALRSRRRSRVQHILLSSTVRGALHPGRRPSRAVPRSRVPGRRMTTPPPRSGRAVVAARTSSTTSPRPSALMADSPAPVLLPPPNRDGLREALRPARRMAGYPCRDAGD